jgi:formate dehydrogenase (coenzyme F420) alpha subunit
MMYDKYDEKTVNSYCRMCSYRCGVDLEITNGQVEKVSGTKTNRFSEGALCVKGAAIKDLLYSPERLKKTLKKKGSGWQEIGLNTALDEIADKLASIIELSGSRSLAVWKGEALGSDQQRDLAHRFAHALGTPNILSNDTLCAVSKKGAIKSVIGSYPMPDIDNSKSIFIWGANPLASHYPLARKIIKGRKRGLKVVLIDPRRTTFSKHADHLVSIKPGSDGALALGMINVLVGSGRYDTYFVEKHTCGFTELAEYASGFNPEVVERETGVTPAELKMLCDLLFSTAPASSFMVGVGPEHHDNGFNNIRAIASLSALCGCLDRPGGNIITKKTSLNSAYPAPASLVKQKPIGADKYPVFFDNHLEGHTIEALNAVLTGIPYDLKAMILTGANPVLTNPNSSKVREALSSLELFVVRDLFMTETASLAHYVLPAASFLERSEIINYGLPQTIGLTNRVVTFDQCQDEYSFFKAIATRLGLKAWFPWVDEEELNRWLLEPVGITIEELSQKTEGFIFKPFQYEKFQTDGFKTPSGKIEFISEYLFNYGYDRLPVYEKAACYSSIVKEEFNFIMITGGRNVRFNHSCYHNIPRLKKAFPHAELEIHPADAELLGLATGNQVKIRSAGGDLTAIVLVVAADDIVRGFVHLPHGYPDCNVNEISSEYPTDPISGFPAVKSVPVNITKF